MTYKHVHKKNHINLDAEWPCTYVTKEHINRHTCMILASKIIKRLENPEHDRTETGSAQKDEPIT